MTTSVLVAQITDLHIKRPGEIAYGIVDTAAALTRCVAHLNALRPRPDVVVISGDLVDSGADEEYEHLERLLAPLDLPVVAIPGNHDTRESMRRAFPRQPYAAPSGAMNFGMAVGGLDLILLDSSVPGAPHGLLEDATLVWLDQTLASSSSRPAFIFLHHPPFRAGIWHMDRQNLQSAGAFADILRRHSRVRMLSAGHVHRAATTRFAGIPATICPAPNHAVALDLAELQSPSFVLEPPAFHLHAWFQGEDYGEIVTHVVPIGTFDGPHPFFGPDGRLL
jgi:Icc protein